MGLDRAHRDEQLRTDLSVAAVLPDQGQDLGFSSRDARRGRLPRHALHSPAPVAFWQRHGGSKSEGGGGGDIARKNAEVDWRAGRYESGIRAMEELLRRNGYTVPPAGGK